MLALIALTAGISVALAIWYAFRLSTAPARRVAARMDPGTGDLAFHAPSVLRDTHRSRLPLVDRLPLSATARDRTAVQLEQSGLLWRPNEYLAMRLALALAGGLTAAVVTFLLGFTWPIGVSLALTGTIAGWSSPRVRVWFARRARARRIEEQLPNALTSVAKALRTGSGLLQGLAYAADETPAPLGPELQHALRDLKLGAEAEEVFGALSRRVGSPDLDVAITAIIIQRRVGGNLSEILSTVTETIRERLQLRREISVMTSRQRLTANLTAIVPFIVAVAFIVLNPEMGELLVTTAPGQIALAVGLAFELIGLVAVQRIAAIDV